MSTKIAGTNSYTPMNQNKKIRLASQSRKNNVNMVKIKKKGGKASCGCKGGILKRKYGGASSCGCEGSKRGKGVMYKRKENG